MPRVAVLLTCYNHSAYLPAAVEGVRAQTFCDFEIVALDDGSTDGTREWLAGQPDLRVVLNERNLGTYGTLNRGLELVGDAEFVAVLNDDDVWAPEKLARQVELMDRRPEVALVHTGGHFLNGAGERTEGNPLGFAWPTLVDEVTRATPFLVFENKIIASAALARTAALGECGGFDEGYFGSGDWDMWWRLALDHPVGFVPDDLTGYRVHGANASHKLDRIWRDDERLRERIQSDLDRLRDADELDQKEWNRLTAFNRAALGTVRMLNGRPAEARAEYRASLHADPRRWKSYARLALTYAGRRAFRRLL